MQTIPSSTALNSTLNLGSAIVAVLTQRGATAVPFLARILGRREDELTPYLSLLEQQQVIARERDVVRLK
jgi:hypothetical protein